MLATDNLLFRVHKGVLAEHSSVFRDMLDIAGCDDLEPQGGAGTDSWQGVPIVRMVGDSDEGRRVFPTCLIF